MSLQKTLSLGALTTAFLTYGAAASDATFGPANEEARTVIAQVLGDKIGPTETAWVNVADGEGAYLFVLQTYLCGASDCPVVGFRKTAGGWIKIYDGFGGDGLEVLDTRTKGHLDLRQYESQGGGKALAKTLHWTGTEYGNPTTVRVTD